MDSDSQDSDEGVVLTQDKDESEQPALEAKVVYVLMPKDVPISRVSRVQWWLDRLNCVVTLPNFDSDLEIISTVPVATKILITNKTEVIFLAQSYRFVYCLDMSPSLSTIDVQKGGILLNEVLERFKSSLGGLCRQFVIPGNPKVFHPCIYLTVIVNTPFFMSPAQQVLVKGVQVTLRNLHEILTSVELQFKSLEHRIAHVSALAHDQLEQLKAENEGIVGGLFDLPENDPLVPNIPMVVPDANFVNMLRYSMLAIALLPENSLSHILVITDGIVAMPDSNIMESLLFQLHFDSTALSFLKVGSAFHPNTSATYVPYMDLLYFLSQATLGTCVEDFTYIQEPTMLFNVYHELFLFWSFHTKNKLNLNIPMLSKRRTWNPMNETFCGYRAPPLLSKRQTEEKINAPVLLLLARRMREGYVIDNVSYANGYLEVKLSLLWKNYIYMHCKLTSQWPVPKNAIHFEVQISAPYEFLHDITCVMKKELKSTYRQALIERFWIRITQLTSSDSDLAQHLTIVPHSNVWYTLPESVRSGIPVFQLNSISHDACKLVLAPSDVSCPKFSNFWQPVCQMETNSWRKWFHTHKLSLILKHDHPLPKHLHLANSSGRFQVVQCRQAATALYGMLCNWGAFVLVDNHTYLKFLYGDSEKPQWFCIARVSCKFPCVVLNVGFLTGTLGAIRQKVCENLKEKLSALSYQSSPSNPKENMCCTLLQKPLEKFLIRYERMPSDFTTVIFPDGTQPPHTLQTLPKSPFAGTLFTTLSRYLYHKRWIWSATHSSYLRLDYSAISRILSTLTRMRIKEGFNIAHSSSGIITMVLELEMDPSASCVMQYVLFPPHSALWGEGELCSGSEDDIEPDSEMSSELQMVTEVWIEPQYGVVKTDVPRVSYMNDKQYFDLADVMSEVDLRCIHSLLTLEHLSLTCQDKRIHRVDLGSRVGKYSFLKNSSASLVNCPSSLPENGSHNSNFKSSQRIQHIPFKFDPLNILTLCQMTELLFSMFTEGRNTAENVCANKIFMDNILCHLLLLHDHELNLTKEESEHVTTHILARHRNKSNSCPITDANDGEWRCFIKGLSVTHVVLTFAPANLQSLKTLTSYDLRRVPSWNDNSRASSTVSDGSDATNASPTLPIYSFDCPLALLLDTYINDNGNVATGDLYEDYRRHSENAETNSSEHCKMLGLAYAKCFTLSLYMALRRELFVHYSDVQTATKECEETVEEIDMTEFVVAVCGHTKHRTGDVLNVNDCLEKMPCIEMKYLQEVIQKQFFSAVRSAFSPIPSKSEYYFCRDLTTECKLAEPDSEDEIYDSSELEESKSDKDLNVSYENLYPKTLNPLFLHFTFTVAYNNNVIGKRDFRFLPTCLMEILRDVQFELGDSERSKLKITLNITCLTLPAEIQDGVNSIASTHTSKLHQLQQQAVCDLRDELKWLLKDEIITSLLDIQPVTSDTLSFIIKHVASNTARASCIQDVIGLNFVYDCGESFDKFVEEFFKLAIPSYVICKQGDLYYLAKQKEKARKRQESGCFFSPVAEEIRSIMMVHTDDVMNDNSSEGSVGATNSSEGGYEEDVSENEEEYEWIFHYEQKRSYLPNFWLIMQVDKRSVTIYYHCRFMELSTSVVAPYLDIQRMVADAVRDLCKRVNQSMLLQSLDESRKCDVLLEPDENVAKNISRTASYAQIKGMEESNDDFDLFPTDERDLKFGPGYFGCDVVWETHFVLHPRLKIGPGKSGISRGILALKNILEKFSVTNRDNMFVYRDSNSNVFYLRLHENLQACNSSRALKSGDSEHTTVSRSPSIASLPLGQKSSFSQSEQTSAGTIEVRPRVRSFGEKESNEPTVEDTLILKVHGITEAGQDVKCDLVQVLQNRLDDAVLEFLSIMLARNAMCPLTPEDVHFLQKPFRLPEIVIKISIQDFALSLLDAFQHYLRQNLLQFLNIPKYTDMRTHFHFTDYSETEQISTKIKEDNIFIFNQSQNPSSGNRGIACIALAVVNGKDVASVALDEKCKSLFQNRTFEQMVMSHIIQPDEKLPETYLEFRLWKQGRVNIDNLSQKLKNATSQTSWDIVMEYYLLLPPLCTLSTPPHHKNNLELTSTCIPNDKEYDINDLLELNTNTTNIEIPRPRKPRIRKHEPSRKSRKRIPFNSTAQRSITFDDNAPAKVHLRLNGLEMGEVGALSEVYSRYLCEWLEFGCSLGSPAVKKHEVVLTSRHLTNVSVKEVLGIVQQLSRENPKAFRCVRDGANVEYVPYVPSAVFTQQCVVVSRNFEQWKACVDFNGSLDYPELFNTNSLKHMQKFSPIVVHSKLFVPRQKILLAVIENDQILCYVYNWSKDNADKLLDHMTNLGLWLSVRSSFLSSVIHQKVGLFHNQPMTRKQFLPINNPFIGMIGDMDLLLKFPRDRTRRLTNMPINSPSTDALEAFRDSRHLRSYISQDPVAAFTAQMHEARRTDKKSRDELKKLHAMYQTRTSSSSVHQVMMLMQNSRVIHFCHTPLLFLPKWRLKAAATRDHSLMDGESLGASESEQWHKDLCYVFLCEYRQYLQTMGFMPLQVDLSATKKGSKGNLVTTYFSQRAVLGGILVFTMQLKEPFFITKLYAIECSRLQTGTSRASVNRFTLSFLDECDRIKILMHLHSFTYDFHLRCLYNYVSNNTSVYKLCDRYHLTHFLDDFMKYYNKAPNFALNLVHADTITIRNLMTEGKQLYDYLLANINQYNFEVFIMNREDLKENEYILVQIGNTQQVSYKDAQNRQRTDDFDVTIIVSNLCAPFMPWENVLHLRYYLILTSKSEVYPKSDVEQKLGKFRTVSYTRNISNLSEAENKTDFDKNSGNAQSESECETSTSVEIPLTLSTTDETKPEKSESSRSSSATTPHIEIRQESVNYLGYYSSHEQLMQQLILDYAHITQEQIENMVTKGMVHCRTHLLWNKLVSHQESQTLTYAEFMELKGLARLQNLCDIQPNLGALLNQPLIWYQGLSKLLLTKYSDQNRIYVSADGNIQHYVILHPRYVGAFMLLSMDLHTSRGDLYAVYREPHKYEESDICLADRKALLEGFINCVCFYLWSGMI